MVAHNAELLELLINPVLMKTANWISENGLALAPEKSECVILTKKHSFCFPQLYVQGCRVPVKKKIRCLGVRLDTRLSFSVHAVSTGARKAAVALGRRMPNVSGPSRSKRQLLMSVVHIRLLYGAQVWADKIKEVQKSRNTFEQAQRYAALRVARCYRTVSYMVALFLVRMPLIFLLALGKKRIANLKKSRTAICKLEVHIETIRQWQVLWESTPKASWTNCLIPDLVRWWTSGPREISFRMAQALTGHGCFQQYLWSKTRASNPMCVHC